ncbi:MAG: hypothetical protein JXL84_14005 [Deltaproteobacteria bacterium]|nr:hypothetical protein [Deltaproteobacteria bacterium]
MADDLIVFPAKGQSEQQMEKDKFECYQWAKKQSGFDPMETPRTTSPPPGQKAGSAGGDLLKGAAVGAVGGAIIGKIRHKSGSKGAALGAGAGALLGGMHHSAKRSQDERARQQWEQEQASAYASKRNTYNRALSACLEGKGYTVK